MANLFGRLWRDRHSTSINTLIVGAIAIAALSAAPVRAQGPRSGAEQPQSKIPEAPAKLPRVDNRRTHGLDFLFGALKVAPDTESAKAVEARIWAIWSQTPSDTASLLMTRVKTAIDHKEPDVAIKLLDAVIKLRPDYIEAWNRRATLFFGLKDYGRAMADIREVLSREPRHFGALAGLGMILEELGDDKQALDAFRQALAVNPRMQKIPDHVKALTEKVEGRDI